MTFPADIYGCELPTVYSNIIAVSNCGGIDHYAEYLIRARTIALKTYPLKTSGGKVEGPPPPEIAL